MAKVADGIRYAERVIAGEIVAGEFVRLACQRFLDDLKYGEERGIYFSEPRAQHILNFYKFVPHVKGALAGQPIELMDWHVFILINIFGFVIPLVNEETGEVVMRSDGSGRPVMVRRFRTAYNEVARKNAKSTLSSGIGLYMTVPVCSPCYLVSPRLALTRKGFVTSSVITPSRYCEAITATWRAL